MELLRLGSDRFFLGIYYPLLITLVITVGIYYQLYEYEIAFIFSYLIAGYIILSPIFIIFLRDNFWDEIIEPFLIRHGMPEFVLTQSAKAGDPHIDGSDKQYMVSKGEHYLLLPGDIFIFNSPKAKQILDNSSSSLKKEYEHAHSLESEYRFMRALSYLYKGEPTSADKAVMNLYLKDKELLDGKGYKLKGEFSRRITPKDLEYLFSCLQEGGDNIPRETVKQFLRLTELNLIQRYIVMFIDIFFLTLGLTMLYSLILTILAGLFLFVF